MTEPRSTEIAPDAAAVTQAAERTDVAVITLGRIAGEGGDRTVADDFTLRASERALVEQVATAFHAKGKPVIVVLNVGGPLEIASWRGSVDAILLAYQPGQEGGHAIADVLVGCVNPSGKLATSFPMTYDDIPYGADFPGRAKAGSEPGSMLAGQASENSYNEGVFVGYRYSGTFGKAPAYAFGYGMSYSMFGYTGLQINGVLGTAAGSLTVKATVTNTGKGCRPQSGAAVHQRTAWYARQTGA